MRISRVSTTDVGITPAKPQQRGFTLIEVLVVIAIIAIMSGVLVLNIDFRNPGRVLSDSARRTALLMQLASDQAVYARQQFGIRFHPDSYTFLMLTKNEAGEAVWEPFEEGQLKFKPAELAIENHVDISGVPIILESLEESLDAVDEQNPLKPHVMFLSNGEIMPDFRVTMSADNQRLEEVIRTGEVEPIVVEPRESL